MPGVAARSRTERNPVQHVREHTGMRKISATRTVGNRKGMINIADMIIAMMIMMILTAAIMTLTVDLSSAYVKVSDQSLSQGNSKWALDRMKEEIAQAFPILNSSDGDGIMFTKHGENLDGMDPADAGEDTVCYRLSPPTSTDVRDAMEPDYKPGSVWRGANSGGGGACSWPDDYTRITDNMTDIRSLEFKYCAPYGTTPGGFDCSTTLTDDVNNDGKKGDCVWQVVIKLKVLRQTTRKFRKSFNVTSEASEYTYVTIVRPRNIYLSCIGMDEDANDLPDGLEGTWAERIDS